MKPIHRLARPLVALALMAAAGGADAGSVDNGNTLYNANCTQCHGSASRAINWSATTIRNAINRNYGGMSYLSGLTDSELSDISSYLADPAGNDSDRLFTWAEGQFPSLLTPAARSQTLSGYYLRYYSGTNLYVATSGGHLYFYDANNPGNGVVDLGTITDWLSQAGL